MGAVLTVRIRSILTAAVVLAALLAAYLVGAAGRSAPPAHAAETAPGDPGAVRSIVMVGAGEVTAVPDQLSFGLSVQTKSPDVASALDDANATMRRIQSVLRGHGVARRDVQTSGLSIRPVYDYDGDGPAVITGYAVRESVGVLVRSLGDSGEVIAAAVEAGGNAVRLHGLRLRVGDEEALLRAARDDAVAEATAKARQYAGATGQRLGDVLSLEEVGARRPGPVLLRSAPSALDAAGVSDVPIKAGSSKLGVTVRITWAFA